MWRNPWGRTFRLRIRIFHFPFSLHHLAAQVESGETTQDPGNSAVQLGGRGVSKAKGRAAGERLGWSWLVIPTTHIKQRVLEAIYNQADLDWDLSHLTLEMALHGSELWCPHLESGNNVLPVQSSRRTKWNNASEVLGTQKVYSKCWFLSRPPCLAPGEHVSNRSPQRAWGLQKLLLLSLEWESATFHCMCDSVLLTQEAVRLPASGLTCDGSWQWVQCSLGAEPGGLTRIPALHSLLSAPSFLFCTCKMKVIMLHEFRIHQMSGP